MACAMNVFDPNEPASKASGIFGLPHLEDQAAIVLIPVAWEATTSYGGGAAAGPGAIFDASRQVDLFDLDVDRPYAAGIYMLANEPSISAWNVTAKAAAQEVITHYGELPAAEEHALLAVVNQHSEQVNAYVRLQTTRLLRSGKIVGIVGGDHSVPFGAFDAIGAELGEFGILHVDAHSDTRKAYEGFEYSHASIMYNALESIPAITRIVQVGIRDVCEQEIAYCQRQGERVRMVTDRELQRRLQKGESFASFAKDCVASLPSRVWVSFDIDGLDPQLCPHTGTPVPGGLSFAQAVGVLRELASSGRTIVGFDLNEVAPNQTDESDEWDANVGARMLYKLCAFTLASQGCCKLMA
jgi:agmatinase